MIRFRFVQDHQAVLPVKRMCELVELPRSSFYAWVNHTPSAREIADVELLVVIRDIYARSRNTFNRSRRLHRRMRLLRHGLRRGSQPGFVRLRFV